MQIRKADWGGGRHMPLHLILSVGPTHAYLGEINAFLLMEGSYFFFYQQTLF